MVDEWEVGEGKLDGGYLGVFSKKTGETICRVSPLDKMTEDDVSNACKMAASNELYEALRSIENDDERIPSTIWDMRNKAIAKAEGKDN